MGKLDQPPAVGRTVRLGIRTNLAQFSLLVGVNALVGGMVGQERTLLPLMARRIFHLQAFTAVLTFLVAFGLVKAGGLGAGMWSPFTVRKSQTCTVPTLPGETVHVVLSDTGGMIGGGMMGGGYMMSVATSPSVIASGDVRFAVWNAGMMVYELVVLLLPPGGTGTRPVALD